jgi:ABC-2 type transport system permease protein
MTVFKYALLRSLRSPLSIIASIAMPVALIILMANAWIYVPPLGMGLLVFMMMYSSPLLAGMILEDRIDGSIARVLISPVSKVSYIFQNLLSAIIPLMIQIILLGILGLIRYNWSIEFAMGVVVSMTLFAIANTAFAFCWNMFFKSKAGSKYSLWFAVAVISFISGLLVPIEVLPDALRNIGAFTHPYWLMRSANVLVQYGMNMEFWLFMGALVLFSVAFLLLGGRGRKI